MTKNLLKLAAIALFVLLAAVSFAAAQSGGAKGKVRSTKGDAIAGVEVTARLDGQDVKKIKTDSNGKFEMTGLAAGTYNFLFDKTGYTAGVKFNVVIKSSVVDLGDRLILGVDSGSLVIIAGSVFDQDGRSVTGAKVEIVRISGGEEKKLDTGYTNVSGEFAFRQPNGNATYRLTASARGQKASKEITVEGAGRYRLALTLNIKR